MELRFPVAPMKATLGSLPAADDDRWAYEIKWDGHRTLVHVDGEQVRVQSGGGKDVTHRWPEVVAIADHVNAGEAILDGEVVVLGDDGLPSFDLVQRRHGPGTPDADQQTAGHLMFHAFDVVSVDGTVTTGLPYVDRRRLLASLVEPGPHWSVPEHRVGGGAELVRATAELGLEGVIAKRLDSTYRVGARSKDWLKIKHRRTVELPIGGFTTGTGNRATTFGALLVGQRDDATSELRFAGGVGTGFDQRILTELTSQLRDLMTEHCPFDPEPPRAISRSATWVEPALMARIEIAEFTNDGHVRHASFVELVDGSV
ncbi:MAG: non-homologous end-joining DNA ligase [Actinomycetota bacterium]